MFPLPCLLPPESFPLCLYLPSNNPALLPPTPLKFSYHPALQTRPRQGGVIQMPSDISEALIKGKIMHAIWVWKGIQIRMNKMLTLPCLTHSPTYPGAKWNITQFLHERHQTAGHSGQQAHSSGADSLGKYRFCYTSCRSPSLSKLEGGSALNQSCRACSSNWGQCTFGVVRSLQIRVFQRHRIPSFISISDAHLLLCGSPLPQVALQPSVSQWQLDLQP